MEHKNHGNFDTLSHGDTSVHTGYSHYSVNLDYVHCPRVSECLTLAFVVEWDMVKTFNRLGLNIGLPTSWDMLKL